MGPFGDGTRGGTGGISPVEGEMEEGNCCTWRCIAGFQTRDTESWELEVTSGWVAALCTTHGNATKIELTNCEVEYEFGNP